MSICRLTTFTWNQQVLSATSNDSNIIRSTDWSASPTSGHFFFKFKFGAKFVQTSNGHVNLSEVNLMTGGCLFQNLNIWKLAPKLFTCLYGGTWLWDLVVGLGGGTWLWDLVLVSSKFKYLKFGAKRFPFFKINFGSRWSNRWIPLIGNEFISSFYFQKKVIDGDWCLAGRFKKCFSYKSAGRRHLIEWHGNLFHLATRWWLWREKKVVKKYIRLDFEMVRWLFET